MTRIVFAPNWIGDAVMALPAIADIRRQSDTEKLVIAARPGIADVMRLAPGVDGVVALAGSAGLGPLRHITRDVIAIEQANADVAILLPNSMHSALLAARAGIRERWGYARDMRRLFLSRGIRKPAGAVHQIDYYRHLVAALGFANGPREPLLEAPPAAKADAQALLANEGWSGTSPLVGIAPGAAYGGAKRWPPERFAAVIAELTGKIEATCAIVGSPADAKSAAEITRELGRLGGSTDKNVINLVGRTDLPLLCGVLSLTAAFVSNDSGAMHLAAALDVPVVALFGPTNELATAPAGRRGTTVLTSAAWCRPCMLRECPLDHRCMTGIEASAVVRAVKEWM